jgi:hypothetical protein
MNFRSIKSLLCYQLDDYVSCNFDKFIRGILALHKDAVPELLILKKREILSKYRRPLGVTFLLIEAAKIGCSTPTLRPLIVFVKLLEMILVIISIGASVSYDSSAFSLIETVGRLNWFPEDVIGNLWTLYKRLIRQKCPSLKIDFEILKEISLLVWAFHVVIWWDNIWLPTDKKKIDT